MERKKGKTEDGNERDGGDEDDECTYAHPQISRNSNTDFTRRKNEAV